MPIITLQDFAIGSEYPPERERGRVAEMEKWNRYSHRKYAGLWTDQATARLRPNLFRFLEEFWQDAIWADRPVVEYQDAGRQQEYIDAITASLFEAGREVMGDMIRYGVGIFINRRPDIIQSVDPRFWFPLREAYDDSIGETNVIAYPYSADARHGGTYADHIQVEVRSPDGVEITRRVLEGMTLAAVADTETHPGSAFQVVPVRSGNGFYGVSDFADAEEYVAEIQRRETGIAQALDKHVNPHLAVPEGSLVTNIDGSVTIQKEGMVLPVPEGGQAPSYITWEPQFDAQHKALERAEDRILQSSKIAPVLIHMLTGNVGATPTGAALRRLAIVTVNRIRQIRARMEVALTDTILGAAALRAAMGEESIPFERDKISFKWPAELSSGTTDEADSIRALVDSGALTQETALQLVERISSSEAEAIVAKEQREARAQAQRNQRAAQGGRPRPIGSNDNG